MLGGKMPESLRLYRALLGMMRTCSLVVIAGGILLSGCANPETSKKQVRESEGYYKQGISFLDTDQQRAFVAFQQAIQLNPQNFDAHYALGSIYFQRREFPLAEREFRISVQLNPNSGEALNYLGRTLANLSRWAEAAEVLRRATRLVLYATPDIAYADLGAVLYQQGDVVGAIRAYEDALRIEPPNVPRALVYLELARLYKKQGELSKAREALAQAKALDPSGTTGAEASKLMERLQ